MARLRCTGLTAKDAAICGSAVAITVPSRFSMKSAQATVRAMTADRSSWRMAMFYRPGGAYEEPSPSGRGQGEGCPRYADNRDPCELPATLTLTSPGGRGKRGT